MENDDITGLSCIDYVKKYAFEYVNQFLDNLEKELGITILYACETGSRALGTDVEESDFDIKGFYISSESEYLRVIRKINPNYIIHHLNLKVGPYEFDLDVELKDIKFYFLEKLEANTLRADFWFKSKVIYRNLFTDDIYKVIQTTLYPGVYIFSPDDKSGVNTLRKNLTKQGGIMNKKVLGLIISAIQYLHTELFDNEFPVYNIFKEIEYVKCHKEKVLLKLSVEEYGLLENMFDLVSSYYLRKQQGRVSVTKSIPNNLVLFIEMISDKFKPEEKRKVLNKFKCVFDEEWAEKTFDYLLEKYKKQCNKNQI
jgi:hypothetical protein